MKTKDILKSLREKHNYTIQDVSKGTGMTYTMCREYETGDRNLGLQAVVKLADFYGVTTDYLLGRAEEQKCKNPIEQLAEESHLSSIEKTMLEMYFKLDPIDRANFLEAMIKAVQSSAEREYQATITVNRAARNSTPPSTGTITNAEADEIRNRPDADSDL